MIFSISGSCRVFSVIESLPQFTDVKYRFNFMHTMFSIFLSPVYLLVWIEGQNFVPWYNLHFFHIILNAKYHFYPRYYFSSSNIGALSHFLPKVAICSIPYLDKNHLTEMFSNRLSKKFT